MRRWSVLDKLTPPVGPVDSVSELKAAQFKSLTAGSATEDHAVSFMVNKHHRSFIKNAATLLKFKN